MNAVAEPCGSAALINGLASKGATSLLELVSTFTGRPTSAGINERIFAKHLRLVYTPDTHSTSSSTPFGATSLTHCVWHAEAHDSTFDVVFADPWHTVGDTIRILVAATKAARPGGIIVMHDCHPRDPELRTSEFDVVNRPWCGETWKVWHRLTTLLEGVTVWRTIDQDFGIGILVRPTSRVLDRKLRRILGSLLASESDWAKSLEWKDSEPCLHLSEELSICGMMSE